MVRSVGVLTTSWCVAAMAQPAPPPAPVLPTGPSGGVALGPLGEPVRLPGPYPSRAMGGIVELSPPRDGLRGSVARVLASSPDGVTVNWAQPGDFDVNLAPTDPLDPLTDASSPVWGFMTTSSGVSAILGGPPTYAWAPHATRGILLASVASHEPDAFTGGFVEAHAAGAIEASREGPAYSMLDGQWRPAPDVFGGRSAGISPGHLWVDVLGIGSGREGYATAGVAWFPFEDGWVGGIVPGVRLRLEDLPTAEEIARAVEVETVGPVDAIDYERTSPGRVLPWLVEPRADDIYSEFEGAFEVEGGEYEIWASGDDAFAVDLFGDGGWSTIAGVPGLHGMRDARATVELPEGRHRVRVRHFQGSLYWGLRVMIGGGEFATRVPLVFDGGASVRAWSFDRFNAGPAGFEMDPGSGLRLASPSLPDDAVTWRSPKEWSNARSSVADLVIPGISPRDSVLMTQSYFNNRCHLTSQTPGRDGWVVQTADASTLGDVDRPFSHRYRGFQFLVVPTDRPGVFAARVDGASGEPTLASEGVACERLGPGKYRVSFGADAARTGVALVQVIAPSEADLATPFDRFATWERQAAGSITVETRHATAADVMPLVDTDFSIVWLTGLEDRMQKVSAMSVLGSDRKE